MARPTYTQPDGHCDRCGEDIIAVAIDMGPCNGYLPEQEHEFEIEWVCECRFPSSVLAWGPAGQFPNNFDYPEADFREDFHADG